MIDNIDFSQWPTWLIATLLILNLFKTPLGNLFPAAFRFFNAKALANAEIAEIAAEGFRQDEVAEKMMLANLLQHSLDQNRELIEFLKTVVVARLDTLIDIANENGDMRQRVEKAVQK